MRSGQGSYCLIESQIMFQMYVPCSYETLYTLFEMKA